jgi:hypothetical protein
MSHLSEGRRRNTPEDEQGASTNAASTELPTRKNNK